MRAERAEHTLQPTALVAEAYLRLSKLEGRHWESKGDFVRVAGSEMRRVLIDHARRKMAGKRGARPVRVTLDQNMAVLRQQPVDLLDLERALVELGSVNERHAKLAELRLFAGATLSEAAEALDVSLRTAKRDWAWVRAYLSKRLREDDREDAS